jgi:hypothetical protein
MVRATDREPGPLMVEQRSFEAFYAATYRPLVVQLLG